ncbi:MAG TPA: hypothetical protein VK698_12080 [Kofleriaceae bacterium]|nr:hypothetical protein [Kofleriaceae bacterium]
MHEPRPRDRSRTTRPTAAVLTAALALMATAGCGATLQELRATPPAIKKVDRDAACVFARIQRAAMEEQTCDLCAQLVWTGNWDPTLGEGIVQAHITYYEYWPIMFTVRADGAATAIEKRVPDHYLDRYGEIAERIFRRTDLSRCPAATTAAVAAASP